MGELTLTPQSEKEAVNAMLRAVGESPVNTITGTVTTDVAIAIQTLSATNRRVQSQGWHFNTDYNVVLDLDSDGFIPVGTTIASVYSRSNDVALRQQKLYDRVNRTFVFTNSIQDACTITILEFEDLPEVAREYITQVSKKVYQQEILGQFSANQENQRSEMEAWSNLIDDEAARSGTNMATGTGQMFNAIGRNRLRY
jgi:hypothetical protein